MSDTDFEIWRRTRDASGCGKDLFIFLLVIVFIGLVVGKALVG